MKSASHLSPRGRRVLAKISQTYMLELGELLRHEVEAKTIYPLDQEYFAALNLTPFAQVKVVILARQSPYHQLGQAHGLCLGATRCAGAAQFEEYLQRIEGRSRNRAPPPRSLAVLGRTGRAPTQCHLER